MASIAEQIAELRRELDELKAAGDKREKMIKKIREALEKLIEQEASARGQIDLKKIVKLLGAEDDE